LWHGGSLKGSVDEVIIKTKSEDIVPYRQTGRLRMSVATYNQTLTWENGYIESLNGEIFDMLWKANVLIERWRRDYNSIRPHSSLVDRALVIE